MRFKNNTLSFASLLGAGGELGALPKAICMLCVPLGRQEIARQMALGGVGESDVKFLSQMVFSKFLLPRTHP